MFVGIYAAAMGHRWGAFAALGAITVEFIVYLVAAVVIYRKTMRRPWPKVAPIEDDNDW
jgi:hypothetical protein